MSEGKRRMVRMRRSPAWPSPPSCRWAWVLSHMGW